jgi:hypothetical protein
MGWHTTCLCTSQCYARGWRRTSYSTWCADTLLAWVLYATPPQPATLEHWIPLFLLLLVVQGNYFTILAAFGLHIL